MIINLKFISLRIILAITALAVMVSSLPVASASAQVKEIASHDYIVKLKHNNTAVLTSLSSNIEKQFAFSAAAEFQNIYRFSSPASLESLQQQLSDYYYYLEPDQQIVGGAITAQLDKPKDPGFTTDYTDIDRQWALPKAGFPKAWEKTTGNRSVTVAVIDTGIDHTHEDLRAAKFSEGYNFLNDTTITPRTNSDDNGHGTLITGIIAATVGNRVGISGATWRVTIMPLKALNSRGSGSSSKLAEAIVWAADHKADIINMSLGGLGLGHDSTLSDSIAYAYKKNVLIVSAAGNDVAVTGGNLDQKPVFPICHDNGQNMILGVTATDFQDRKPPFANFGKACIDVSAPGRRILSTTNRDPGNGREEPDAYAYASGTSMAVPYVSAQAALLKSLFPTATAPQLRDRIIATADNVDRLNPVQCSDAPCSGLIGAGRINVPASMAESISKQTAITEGDLVKVEDGTIYYISGSKRHVVSSFVMNQRFAGKKIRDLSLSQLSSLPEGAYAEPLDGTLMKLADESTVYYMSKGLRLPVTGQVFQLRSFSFSSVHTLGNTEMTSWLLGSFLTPPEGSLVRTKGSSTVYWATGGVLRPINDGFYKSRGLNVFPVVYISDNDLLNFPKGDALVL